MHDIKTVSIIGMGALGMLFGRQIFEFMDDEHFCFLTDEKRRERHLQNGCNVNGKHITFPVATVKDIPFTPDLILIATKGDGLIAARSLAESVKGDHTLVLSLLWYITQPTVGRQKKEQDPAQFKPRWPSVHATGRACRTKIGSEPVCGDTDTDREKA